MDLFKKYPDSKYHIGMYFEPVPGVLSLYDGPYIRLDGGKEFVIRYALHWSWQWIYLRELTDLIMSIGSTIG
jgi:hypothetical protein